MDLALHYDAAQGGYDLAMDGNDLAVDETLTPQVLLSLLTDARASADDDLPCGETGGDRRGWWADALTGRAGDSHGSLLWLLGRAKLTAETVNRAREYAQSALIWLVEDGLARAVDVAADPAGGYLILTATVNGPREPLTLEIRD